MAEEYPRKEDRGTPFADLFPQWQTSPVSSQLENLFQQRNILPKDGWFSFSTENQEYHELSSFLADMIDALPHHNEVGDTRFMRDDAPETLSAISQVLRNEKNWQDITHLFENDGKLEVYKNLVFKKHALPSAICYNIDLGKLYWPHMIPYVVIERFHIVQNDEKNLEGWCDGYFRVDSTGYINAFLKRTKLGNLKVG